MMVGVCAVVNISAPPHLSLLNWPEDSSGGGGGLSPAVTPPVSQSYLLHKQLHKSYRHPHTDYGALPSFQPPPTRPSPICFPPHLLLPVSQRPDSTCSWRRLVLIRGLCRPAGSFITGRAERHKLAAGQMKALYLLLELNSHLCPRFSLPLLCFPSFIYFPSSSSSSVFPPSHLLSGPFPCLPSSYRAYRCPASASSSADCGPADPNAHHESSSHLTDHLHIPIRSCFLILPIGTRAAAPSLRSFRLLRARTAGDNLWGTRAAPRISNVEAGSF